MERLTWRCSLDGHEDIGLQAGVTAGDAVARIAAYEDTGLDPEEIKDIVRLFHSYRHICAGLDPDRICEFAQAEKDGRLMVLQDGVSVRGLQEEYCMYKRISDEQLPSPSYTTGLMDGFSNGMAYILGKILTREEAEAALKKREAGNETD